MPVKNIVYYFGKDINSLSKEELIEAINNIMEYYESRIKILENSQNFLFDIFVKKDKKDAS